MDQVNAVAPTYQVSKVSAISVSSQFSMFPQLQNLQMHHSAEHAEHKWTYQRHAYMYKRQPAAGKSGRAKRSTHLQR